VVLADTQIKMNTKSNYTWGLRQDKVREESRISVFNTKGEYTATPNM